MSKLKTAALVIASAVGGGLLWGALHDEPQVRIQVERVKEYVTAPPSARVEPELGAPLNAGTTASGAPLRLIPVHPKHNEFGRKLLQVKSVQEFVTEALAHPEKGGAFYAMLALRQCDSFDQIMAESHAAVYKVVAAESTISTARQADIGTPQIRCAGLSQAQVDALKLEAAKHVRSGTDPLFKLSHALRVPPAQRDAPIEAIVKHGNWALIAEEGIPGRLLQAATTWDDIGPSVRFNGQTYGKEDYEALSHAAEFSACVDGDFCKFDLHRQGHCWSTGACYATREEFLRQTKFKDDPAGFERMLGFAEQMRAALARGDTSVFR